MTRRIGSGVSRRELILATGAAGLSATAGCLSDDSAPSEPAPKTITDHESPALERWVDEVARPAVAEPVGERAGRPYYELEMTEFDHRLHRDLPTTTVWGYDGSFPGPTIEARRGEPIEVRWTNGLPDEHLLPEDTTVHGDAVPYDEPGVRTVTHLHGGNVESASDGHAQAWFTRDFESTGPAFEQEVYEYANEQPAATLWYHDHSLGITRLNVYAGLAGFYLVRSDREAALDLPSGERELPLVLQDRSVDEDGSLFYPTRSGRASDDVPGPSVVPQFYGDVSVVNGTAWPRLSVEPDAYRLRLLNGANSRYYRLSLLEYDEATGERGDDGPPFVLVGADGGLLREPVSLEGRLELGAGQRADVVVDFSKHAGETLLLHNDAAARYRGDITREADDVVPLSEVMLVDVADAAAETTSRAVLPDELGRLPALSVDDVDDRRSLTLTSTEDEYGRRKHLLGTADAPGGLELGEPVTETPTVGDTEIWSFENQTGMSHPMHLHLVHFQVLGRQPLADYDRTAEDIDLDALEPPEPYERGWKDVVSVDPAEVVHVLAHFGEYEGEFADRTGRYMWHCHMIEHEDYDMMRPFEVGPADESEAEGEATGDR